MRGHFRLSLAAGCLCGLLLLASSAHGQAQLSPRISHVMPMGGQAGATVEVRVTGQDLLDVQGLRFNFPGVKTEALSSDKAPIEMKKGKPAPGLTVHKFKVALPSNAPLGIQDLRIVTKAGISNPRAFVISDHKEYVEEEPNDDVPKAQKIELNSTVNGVISGPIDVDYYSFFGKKGQRVVCSCLTTSIDSKLPVELQLHSADNRDLGTNRGYAHNDALVDAVLPEDGEYNVRVCCYAYTQGGVDNFYRLTVSTAPWIDAVFPPIVEPGKETQVMVYGRNLPGGQLDPTALVNQRPLEKALITIKPAANPAALQRLAYSGFIPPPASMLDGFELRVKNGVGSSNPYLLTYAPAPVILDNGDNDEQDKAQKISVPCVIAGTIEKRADRDWYVFQAKKGQVWSIEAAAERLGAPMDLFFQLRNANGNLITEQDDTPAEMTPQFFTASTDPQKYRFVVPADGTYSLMVTSRDAFTQASPRHLYTVRITPEEPDFRLVAMPTAPITPEGVVVSEAGGAAYSVYVWRFGGFNHDITLTGANLPDGLSVQPQSIASAQKQGFVVVHADAGAKSWEGPITILGTATVNGQKLVREVRSATISWPVAQVNIPTITRLDRELVLAVRDKAPYHLIVGKEKILVLQGEKISIPVTLSADTKFKLPVQVAALGGPAGLISLNLSLTPGSKGGTVTLDAKGNKQIEPGNYTIFLRGQTQPVMLKQPAKGAPPNLVQYSLPVSVTVVPKQLGMVSAVPAATKVSVGKSVEVTVRFARQFDLPIALKVEAVLPPNAMGISAKDVVIKANEDEAKLVFTASPQALIGTAPTITIRATAMFNDTIPVVHETKLTLAITK